MSDQAILFNTYEDGLAYAYEHLDVIGEAVVKASADPEFRQFIYDRLDTINPEKDAEIILADIAEEGFGGQNVIEYLQGLSSDQNAFQSSWAAFDDVDDLHVSQGFIFQAILS